MEEAFIVAPKRNHLQKICKELIRKYWLEETDVLEMNSQIIRKIFYEFPFHKRLSIFHPLHPLANWHIG
jgi:hypothetical protein